MLDLIKWAAGAASRPGYPDGVEPDELLTLAHEHRVTGRLLRRLERERPDWLTESIRLGLLDRQRANRRIYDQQMAEIDRLSDLVSSEQPIVVVKGLSAFAVAGDNSWLRATGDLDLFVGDLDSFIEALPRLGYRHWRRPSAHEAANVVRDDGLRLDIHRYFPVWSYSPDLRAADLHAAHHPDLWVQTADIDRVHLTYGDIAKHCLERRTPSAQRTFLVPSPEMGIIITCAHMFKNYVSTYMLAAKVDPVVLLGEVAEVLDLSRHPAFDAQRFLTLVHEFGATDCVAAMNMLMRSALGFAGLPLREPIVDLDEPHQEAFPRSPWWSFWSIVDWPLEDTFEHPAPYGAVVEQLQPNTIQAGPRPGPAYSALSSATGEALPRVIVNGPRDAWISFDLSVTWGSRGLSFDVTVPKWPVGEHDRVRVDLGPAAVEWEHWRNEPATVTRTSAEVHAEANATPLGDGYRMALTVHWGPRTTALQEAGAVSLCVGVGALGPENRWLSGTLVPLRVIRTD